MCTLISPAITQQVPIGKQALCEVNCEAKCSGAAQSVFSNLIRLSWPHYDPEDERTSMCVYICPALSRKKKERNALVALVEGNAFNDSWCDELRAAHKHKGKTLAAIAQEVYRCTDERPSEHQYVIHYLCVRVQAHASAVFYYLCLIGNPTRRQRPGHFR